MADYSSFRFGGVDFPLLASTTNSPLRDADPSIYFALDYLAAMIIHYAGARIVAEMAKVGLKDSNKHPYTSAVGHKVGYDPSKYLTQEQVKFPLLCIFRDTDQFTEHTSVHRRETCDVTFMYVFPPLTPAQAERLVPLLKPVSDIVGYQIEQGMDPSYTPPGSTLAGGVWAAAGLDRIQLMTGKWTDFEAGGNLVFPCWQGSIQLVERTEWIPANYENFTGSDVHLDLKDHVTGTTITDFVSIATDIG